MIRAFGFLKKAAAKVNKEFVWMQMLLITSRKQQMRLETLD